MTTPHTGFFLKNEQRQASAKRRLMAPMNKTVAFSAFFARALCEGNGKLAKELDSLGPSSNVDVNVQFEQVPLEVRHQKIRKTSLDLVKESLYSAPTCKLKEPVYDPAIYGDRQRRSSRNEARTLKGKK
jgi:hypothetical protein